MVDVQVIRPAGRDRYGNRSGDAADGPLLTGCAVAPKEASDVDDRATDGHREQLDVFCPDIDADVHATDQVSIDGLTYDVDGEPARWNNPLTGARPGCVITVSRRVA